MNLRKGLGLVSALLFAVSVAAFAAAAPAVPKSDRWFHCTWKNAGGIDGFLHITIKPSGDADAPVRFVCEQHLLVPPHAMSMTMADSLFTLDSTCLNDEWLSPVKIAMASRAEHENKAWEAVITRPDSKSTAGKMVQTVNGQKKEWDVKERTVLPFAAFELVGRLPFEEGKSFDIETMEFEVSRTATWKLSCAGEEDVEVQGQTRKLHKCVLDLASRGWRDEYWLTDKHELVQAKYQGMRVVAATETEARKPVADWEAKRAGAANAERMSEGIAGCETIRRALGVRQVQNGMLYPILDDVAGDELAAALHIAPKDLDSAHFKAANYVVNSTAKGYTVKAVLGAQTYVIDDKGVESGTYRTK